jgi:hypothetical protein
MLSVDRVAARDSAASVPVLAGLPRERSRHQVGPAPLILAACTFARVCRMRCSFSSLAADDQTTYIRYSDS